MAKPRLTTVVPVRLLREHKIALRKMARESNSDVSELVRDWILERLSRNAA
jgi:hypothetical protein